MHTKDNVLALRLGIGSVLLALSVALTSGFAAAQGQNGQDNGNGDGPPANVTQCKTMWQQLGFKNQGQCVASYNREKEGNGYGGHGYGGDDNHHHHFNFPFNIGAFESWVAQFFAHNGQG